MYFWFYLALVLSNAAKIIYTITITSLFPNYYIFI